MKYSGFYIGLFLAALSSGVKGVDEVKVMGQVPPAPEQQVTLNNYRLTPYSQWAFNNAGAPFNTLMIARGKGEAEFSDHPQALSSKQTAALEQVFASASSDSLIVLQSGKVLFEQYWGEAGPHQHHIWFSMTKSLVSAAFGILLSQGKVDLGASPADYIPELKGSGYERVTIQNILNHSSAIAFKENYTDPNSDFLKVYAPALNMAYIPGGRDAQPGKTEVYGVQAFAAKYVKPNTQQKPGEVFEYNSSNTDVLGWLISRISGMSLHKFIQQHLWQHLATEHDAFMAVDRAYMPVATAGMNTTLRDAARFGLMIVNKGHYQGRQLIAKDWIEAISQVSDKQQQKMRHNPLYSKAGWQAYNNMWWILDADKGEFAAAGIHGQILYINRSKNIVSVFFSHHPIASNARSPDSASKIAAIRALASER